MAKAESMSALVQGGRLNVDGVAAARVVPNEIRVVPNLGKGQVIIAITIDVGGNAVKIRPDERERHTNNERACTRTEDDVEDQAREKADRIDIGGQRIVDKTADAQ